MRILQVTRVFHPHLGGIEKHVEWLSRALLARGHHVEVLTLDRSFADGTRYPPTDVLDADTARPLRVTRVPFAGSTRYPLAPGILPHLKGWDVVHVHAIDFLADAVTLTRPWHRTPVVLSTHGGFFHTSFARRAKQAWFHTATRALVHAVDALVYTSDQDEELFRAITKRGTLLRSAVELGPWRALSPSPEPGRFVTTGRVDVHKGIPNLVRTLAALQDVDPRPFSAHIVGPEVVPGLLDDLRAQARSLGVHDGVHAAGAVVVVSGRGAYERRQPECGRQVVEFCVGDGGTHDACQLLHQRAHAVGGQRRRWLGCRRRRRLGRGGAPQQVGHQRAVDGAGDGAGHEERA